MERYDRTIRPLEVRRLPNAWFPPAGREFHVSRKSRDSYDFHETIFQISGNVVFADFHAARLFAHKLNESRDLTAHPERTVKASAINAMGLIDEVMHYLVSAYREQNGTDIFEGAMEFLAGRFGADRVDSALAKFLEQFPPREVYRGRQTQQEYLSDRVENLSGRERSMEEFLMLWLENQNPAFAPYRELFDDAGLQEKTAYLEIMEGLREYFQTLPGFGAGNESLVDLLLAPSRAHPYSLEEQLKYIRTRWSRLIGRYLFRLLRSLDLVAEENRAVFAGPGPTRSYEYGGLAEEVERFSPDRDWMPNVVLLAKSTLVWLDQLSKAYRREIRRLDQIPDEELDLLASQGFNALWLIGLWRRSNASRRIKQMCGNPEAEASAYSLLDYEIADSLGGWDSLQNLRDRCWARGIRLASDMVPNHTGIDSGWVHDHPEWFVQLDYSPFPGYTFNGPNLTDRPGVGIFLEDHYYDRSDAAVVFKRVDFSDGRARYIYHGNDGTSMPWNDTAQLNFLNPELREAIIQTILHVAHNFPIIRFDAAMTLAKKHIQRLWFPEPGSGGDIASRSEHGLSREDFNRAMPEEFWREVVDRVAAEVPDTLLLAEAFWMMEGYFVRTLGMHRVYNSAFMNMLKNEENSKYRQTIKNTLEFDPDILKRFVNFMNNPDEDTAIAQFGDGDKYFGVCTLMLTMPGLPMIGHGQVQGFREKYGMEYSKAYWDEEPNYELIRRHEREIFPLMKRRYLFSGVDNFYLYDLYGDDGRVNENVFAYSNGDGNERSLVLYNNAYEASWGWIRGSAGFVKKDGSGNKEFRQGNLAQALSLHNDFRYFCIFYDHVAEKWFIRNSAELWEKGLFVNLSGYQTQVFLHIYEVMDNEYSHYARLADSLGGAGVKDVSRALKEIFLQPLHDSFTLIANSGVCRALAAEITEEKPEELLEQKELRQNYVRFLRSARDFVPCEGSEEEAGDEFVSRLRALVSLKHLDLGHPAAAKAEHRKALAFYAGGLTERPGRIEALISMLVIKPLEVLVAGRGAVSEDGTLPVSSGSLAEDWLLFSRLEQVQPAHLEDGESAQERHRRLRILLDRASWFTAAGAAGHTAYDVLEELTADPDVRSYLGFNLYDDVLWFHKERFRVLMWWLFTAALWDIRYRSLPAESEHKGPLATDKAVAEQVLGAYRWVELFLEAEDASEYQVQKLLDAVHKKSGSSAAKSRTARAGSSKGSTAGGSRKKSAASSKQSSTGGAEKKSGSKGNRGDKGKS